MSERDEPSPDVRLGLTESETHKNLKTLDLLFIGRWNQMTLDNLGHTTADDVLDLTHKLINTDMAAREWKIPPAGRRPTLGHASLVLARFLDQGEATVEDKMALQSSLSVFVDRINEIAASEHILRQEQTEFIPLTTRYVHEVARQLSDHNLARVADVEPTTEYLRIAGQHFSPEQPPEDSEH